MELQDMDLKSIQEVRVLLKHAKEAQRQIQTFSQEQIDEIVKAVALAAEAESERLAKLAWEETGFGKWQDKVIKNQFGSRGIYEAIRSQKTVGIIAEDREQKTIDIGCGVGVIAGIVPSTNPTSTVFYKSLIALKGGNAIVFSPHPGAKNCIIQAVAVVRKAAKQAGCPEDAIGVISTPTLAATQELMRHQDTALILATGGGAMVKAAYSSGTPAIGVGAGNGPAFIDRTANVSEAIRRIIDSKTFDNGTICASEQSILIERSMQECVLTELEKQGGYLLNEIEAKRLGSFLLRPNGTMNPLIVGKSAKQIAELAGLSPLPDHCRVLIARETKVGEKAPYSHEKLAPILALFVEENEEAILQRAKEILSFEGAGHTFCMHTEQEEQVKRFALAIPASRILVNTPGALGGIGATTNLFPALTLGCGAVGGSSSSNNIGPMDVINIKRVAYGVKELSEIRKTEQRQASSICSTELVESLLQKILKELI